MSATNVDAYAEFRKGICEGCPTLLFINEDEDGEKIYCSLKPKKEDAICPCSTCLIKPMCREDCIKLYFFLNLYSITYNQKAYGRDAT